MALRSGGSCDVLLLGTSPIMMIKALHFRHQGARVVVLERESRLGGSWYTRDLWGYKNVEFSVHELLERPHVYRFFEECLGLEMVPSPQANGRWGTRRFGIATYRLFVLLRVLVQHARAGMWDELLRFRQELARKLRYARVTTRYPAGGAVPMLQRLHDLLGEAGVPIELGVAALGVELDADRRGGVCRTSEGDLRFGQVVFGQSAHCPVSIAGEPFPFEAQTKLVTSLLLHVEGEVLDSGPLYTFDDPLVRRFRSVGGFQDPPLPPGQAFLALSTSDPRYTRPEAAADTAAAGLTRLVELGIVAPGARLIAHHMENYPLTKISRGERARMERALAPAVLMMPTWDLSECLETMLHDPRTLSLPRRWRR
jgi:hypothetical protein